MTSEIIRRYHVPPSGQRYRAARDEALSHFAEELLHAGVFSEHTESKQGFREIVFHFSPSPPSQES